MKENIRDFLARRPVHRITVANRIPSAVLIPLYIKNGEYYLLFTKRTQTIPQHKGQVSFPGGRYEEDDKTVLATALRECEEETGLPASQIDILGELDDVLTVTSNYVISPFVGFITYPFELKCEPTEIECPIEVPFTSLLDPATQITCSEGPAWLLVEPHFYSSKKIVIWGATARILAQFLECWSIISESLSHPSFHNK